jgi:hypothetical protein
MAQGDLKNAAADTPEGLYVFWHPTELHKLNLVANEFLRFFHK